MAMDLIPGNFSGPSKPIQAGFHPLNQKPLGGHLSRRRGSARGVGFAL
jgi:hypothetical protein